MVCAPRAGNTTKQPRRSRPEKTTSAQGRAQHSSYGCFHVVSVLRLVWRDACYRLGVLLQSNNHSTNIFNFNTVIMHNAYRQISHNKSNAEKFKIKIEHHGCRGRCLAKFTLPCSSTPTRGHIRQESRLHTSYDRSHMANSNTCCHDTKNKLSPDPRKMNATSVEA